MSATLATSNWKMRRTLASVALPIARRREAEGSA
jgi:hypothetical protein